MAIKVQGTTIVDDSQALRITGVSSFTNGPVLIGGGTSTGTASQPLQITGGAYISTSTGIGTTNPLQSLHVLGNLLVAAGSSTGQHITQKAYELNSGTLSWEGSAGQLFSITNSLTSGSIFSVNDVSGIPSIDVNADGTIALAPYGTTERVGVGTTAPTAKLDVIGNARVTGVITATTFNGQVNAGVSTLGITSTTNLTTQNINNSGITTTNSLNIGATQVISSGRQLQNIASLDATTTATIESAIANAPNTFNDLNVTGISTLGITSTTNLTTQQLNVSGVSTFAGIATHTASLFGTQASFSGIVTGNTFVGQINAGVGTITTLSGTTATYGTGSFTTGNIVTGVVTTLSGTNISYSGVSSFTNGPVLIGGGTSTGTASQRLQVTGGAYFDGSGSIGIGITNPAGKIHVSTYNETSILLQRGNDTWNAGDYHEIVSRGTTGGNPRVFSRIRTTVVQPVGSSSASVLQFYTNNGTSDFEAARIDGSGNLGIGSTSPTSRLDVIGDARVSGVITASSFSGSGANLTGIIAGYANTAGVSTNVIGGIGSITQLQVTGISTFTNGPVFIGAATSTGTATQRLQVTGGAYVSGNIGAAVTSPSFAVDVSGDARVQSTGKMRFGGTAGTTNFYIQYNSTTSSLDFVAG